MYLIGILRLINIIQVKNINKENRYLRGIYAFELRKLPSIWRFEEYEHIIFFPRQAERGRRYIHLLTNKVPIYFVKIVTDQTEYEKLEREYEALLYCRKNIKYFTVPDPIAIHTETSFCAVLQSSLGHGRPYLEFNTFKNILSIAKEISEREISTITPSDLKMLFWWKKLNSDKSMESTLFYESLERELLKVDGVRVNLAHGDLGSHNIKKHNHAMVVFDWEDSAVNAPYLTDYLGAFHHYYKINEAGRFYHAFEKWWKNYMPGCELKKIDLMLALLFRHSTGNSDVRSIIQTWEL